MTVTRYFSLGRFAMKEALSQLGVGKGDAVMLPSFICRDLVASIAELGATPVFYAVNEKLEPVSLDPTKNAKVIIAVNYFGFTQNLEPFRKYCSKTGAAIIEDNAHGLFSRDENNVLLGQRAVSGMTSFRKSLRVEDGAFLTTSLGENTVKPQISFSDLGQPRRINLLKKFAIFQKHTGLPFVFLAQTLSRVARFIRTGETLPKSDPKTETEIPGKPNPLRASIEVLEQIDERKEVARRRDLYLKLAPQVAACGAKLVFPNLPQHTCPYGLPLFVTADVKSKLAKIARRNRVTLMSWPDLPTTIASNAPAHYKQVWLLNFQ